MNVLVFRGMLVFLDDQAYQEEKVNRYDSSVEKQASCGVFYVFMDIFFELVIVKQAVFLFQGDIGPSGTPGIPGKEGLIGPKVCAVLYQTVFLFPDVKSNLLSLLV